LTLKLMKGFFKNYTKQYKLYYLDIAVKITSNKSYIGNNYKYISQIILDNSNLFIKKISIFTKIKNFEKFFPLLNILILKNFQFKFPIFHSPISFSSSPYFRIYLQPFTSTSKSPFFKLFFQVP